MAKQKDNMDEGLRNVYARKYNKRERRDRTVNTGDNESEKVVVKSIMSLVGGDINEEHQDRKKSNLQAQKNTEKKTTSKLDGDDLLVKNILSNVVGSINTENEVNQEEITNINKNDVNLEDNEAGDGDDNANDQQKDGKNAGSEKRNKLMKSLSKMVEPTTKKKNNEEGGEVMNKPTKKQNRKRKLQKKDGNGDELVENVIKDTECNATTNKEGKRKVLKKAVNEDVSERRRSSRKITQKDAQKSGKEVGKGKGILKDMNEAASEKSQCSGKKRHPTKEKANGSDGHQKLMDETDSEWGEDEEEQSVEGKKTALKRKRPLKKNKDGKGVEEGQRARGGKGAKGGKEENEGEVNTSKNDLPGLRPRACPTKLVEIMKKLSNKQIQTVKAMGFGKVLKLQLDRIPAKLGHFVVDKFDPTNMVIDLGEDKKIVVNEDAIHKLLGLPNVGLKFSDRKAKISWKGLKKEWKDRFPEAQVLPSDVASKIKKNPDDDGLMFEIDFAVLFLSTMVVIQGQGKCRLKFVHYLDENVSVKDINWCNLIVSYLKTSKEGWRRCDTTSYYNGPITILLLLYAEAIESPSYKMERKTGPLQYWTFERLKERQEAEIEGEGFGNGSLRELVDEHNLEADDDNESNGGEGDRDQNQQEKEGEDGEQPDVERTESDKAADDDKVVISRLVTMLGSI
ncbi:hypothetical protein SSX86_026440 [Deinandra increscens subsp. villosa]|uniref:Uncharacterized protein n=1 Tax=Deinandra increscens subsp. villosa TaxID=3103831 RepID=A0AAP0CKB4_9ASTR